MNENQEIYIFHFKTILNKKTWLYEIKRRLSKSGKNTVFVSPEDYDLQYKRFLQKNQRLVAVEMETVYLESATVDAACSTLDSNLFEQMSSSIENINFESATTDIRKSLTSLVFNSSTDLDDKRQNEISQSDNDNSESSLDKSQIIEKSIDNDDIDLLVLIASDVENIKAETNSLVTWPITIYNFDNQCHTISWSFSDISIDISDPNISVDMKKHGENEYKCQFSMNLKRDFHDDVLICKILHKADDKILATSSVNIEVRPAIVILEMIPEFNDIMAKKNESIELKWQIRNEFSSVLDLNSFVWYKDKMKMSIDNVTTICSLDYNEGQIMLTVLEATQNDAGIYSLKSRDTNKLILKNDDCIDVRVTVGTDKDTTYLTANQEESSIFEQADLVVITPGRPGVTISGYTNEFTPSDNFLSLITTINSCDSLESILSVTSKCIVVEEHGDAIIEVKIEKQLLQDPQWMFNHIPLATNVNVNWHYNAERGSATLTIKGCGKGDEGMYTCRAVNPDNRHENCVDIEMKVLPQVVSGFLNWEIEEIDLKSGETLTIVLKSTGIEEPILKTGCWYLNSKLLDLKKWKGECAISEDLLCLCIPDVTKDISGIIQFKIEKPKLICSPEIETRVREADKKLLKKLISDLKIRVTKQHLEIMENDEILLEVEIISGDLARYEGPEWTLDNHKVTNTNAKMYVDNGLVKLYILSCKPEDAGKYKCTFRCKENRKEDDVTEIFNVVVNKSEVDFKEKIVPIFNSKSSIIRVEQNAHAVLEVELMDKIKSEPKWFFNGGTLKANDNIEIHHLDDNKLSKIIIKNCQKVHEGVYQCKVVNPGSNMEESIDIELKVVQKQVAGFLDCDIEEIDLKTGETLKLVLTSTGVEEELLKAGCWYLNSKLLDLKKHQGEFNVSNHSIDLHVPSVTKDLRGTLQYKILKPTNLSSPEIEIKVRDAEKKTVKFSSVDLTLKEVKSFVELEEKEELCLELEILSGTLSLYKPPFWTLNDKEIVNVNCKRTSDSKSCKLRIPSCSTKDAGTYKCIFLCKNSTTGEAATATFTVFIKKINRTLNCPNSSIKVFEGESVALCVEVEGFQENDIKWSIFGTDDYLMSNHVSDHITTSFKNDLAILHIDNVNEKDTGKYFCKGFLKSKSISEVEQTLTVVPKEDSVIKCSVSFEKERYIVEEGEDIVMKVSIKCCSVHYSLIWFYNFQVLEMNSDISSDFIENGDFAELRMKHCLEDKAGHYRCTIEHRDGYSSTAETILQINRKIDRRTLKLYEGDTMSLEVDIVDTSENQIWSKNHVILGSGFIEKSENNKFCLCKEKITTEDSGVYLFTCRLQSAIQHRVEFHVTIETKGIVRTADKLKLLCDRTEILANENEPLILSVEIENWKEALIQWYLNGEPFFDSYPLDSQFIDLFIESPSSTLHTGIFRCAVTTHDNEVASVDINVTFAGGISSPAELLDCTVEEVDVVEGSQFQLAISSKRNTNTNKDPQWFKDNCLIDKGDSRICMLTQPTSYNLIINKSRLIDRGLYCLKVGDSSVEIVVKVRTKPVETREKNSDKGMVAPRVKFGMKDVELEKEAQTVKFEFQTDQKVQAKAAWYFEDRLIGMNESEFIQSACDSHYSLTIPMAYEKHCGKYTIKVSNEAGFVQDEARLTMVLKAKAISLTQQSPEFNEEPCCMAPMFIKKLKSIDLSSNDVLRLDCLVMSEPEPKILWTRNGEALDSTNNNNNKMTIINNFPNYELTIADMTFKEAGQYCCLASNFLGFDTTEAFVTVDGQDFDESIEPELTLLTNQAIVTPLNEPTLQITTCDSDKVSLSWTKVSTTDDSMVTYSLEKQRFSKSSQWKTIKNDLTETSCSFSSKELPSHECHELRCVATTNSGYEVVSNIVSIEVRAVAPTMPTTKPIITMKDASCAVISWQRGRLDGFTEEESNGRVQYCLEMKDSPKSSWQIVSNEIVDNEFPLHLDPGVSYMFRVSSFNEHGISEPTQSVITRIDRLKLIPDFSLDSPWLHVDAEPCLKWRAASVPNFCEDCSSGIMPEYKVEYRSGRLSPWKTYQDRLNQCQVTLTPEVINSAQELRVSCRNKFGQNGPTRTYRLQTNLAGKNDFDPQSLQKIPNVISTEDVKMLELEMITSDGLRLQWEPWNNNLEQKYMFQKRAPFSHDWLSLEPIVSGNNCFLDLNIFENYSKELRILAVEDDGRLLYNSYNGVTMPSKEQLVATAPENLRITVKVHSHELSWLPSNNHPLVDMPITYVVQYKIVSNLWITIADQIKRCEFTNRKTNELGSAYYRISARNSFGASDFSNEVQAHLPLNGLGMDQIIKSIRYFVIDCEKIKVKWQLCDVVFDNGLNVDDLSFNVEKKLSTGVAEWCTIGSCVGRCSVLITSTFEEENLYRIQPFLDGETLTPSRVFRIYLTKELLVPDLSFTKPDIITDSIKDYFIEWTEPSIESGFSPEGLEICSLPVMMTDLRYELQYYIADTTTVRRIRTKDIKSSQWMTVKNDIKENNHYWTNPDPTKEYVFRVIARNQFGEGQPSRVGKLRPQITIPDFSLVRLNVEDQSPGNKFRDNCTNLTWSVPKSNSEYCTPYSVDVQYRIKGSTSDQDWITLKSNIKQSSVSINELDDKIDYELRIVPVTEFGLGKPSMTSRRPKRHDRDIASSVNPIGSDTVSLAEEVYVLLSNDVELPFNRTYAMDKDGLIWMKDDKPLIIVEGKTKLFSSYRGITSMMISNVKEEDTGSYSVLSRDGDIIQCIRLIKSDAPTFLNSPLNRSINLHENVFVVFKIDGQPPPTVTWRKNWKKIYSSYRTNIVEDKEQSKYSLRISKCILSDGGEYCVRAENAVGYVEVKFHLRIDAQPEMRTIQCYEGDINDRYYMVKQISRGAYSSCQLIVEKSSHREFAGKVFGVNNIGIGKTEFESIRNIRQRNIVELFDAVLNSSEYLILVYERLEGALLAEYISSLNHWNEHHAQLLIFQLLQAISYLHTYGVGHLDIQPCNIMVTGKHFDTIKLFGFSNATKEDVLEKHRHQFSASPFSAPELLKGEPISLKCDVWSVGILSLICLQGHLNVDIRSGSLNIMDGKGLLSEAACDFVVGCLDADNLNRLSSLEAQRHEWFSNTSMECNASLDHLKEDIVKIMTFPEDMILYFSADIESAIENMLKVRKPMLTVDSIPSSPSTSQFSSRASSVSRDGISYERCEQIDEPIDEATLEYGTNTENHQPVNDKYVPNSAKELIFTVPLKDQTIRPASLGISTNLVNLTCQVTLPGSDAFSISWYKNQELLTDSSKTKLEILNGGLLSCTIDNPGENDAGIYRCVARSRLLRAETSGRLLVGDIPPAPGKPTVLFVNDNDVLLTWLPDLSATDDVIYRVDIMEINSDKVPNIWKMIGYTVDNQYLMENFNNSISIARVVAQNKYGFSPYSIASSMFQNQPVTVSSRKRIINKRWMTLTRQSKDSGNLHDLIKDISSKEITADIINEYYLNEDTCDSEVKVLVLNKVKGNYPDFVVQRTLNITEKAPIIDLCLRIKYDHFPIIYGVINEPSQGLRYSIEEFVPGGNLISVLLARAWYSEFTVVTILRQVIETVQFLNSNNILHTNINPSNILVARRTNQLYDIKLIGLHHCKILGVTSDQMSSNHKIPHIMSTFQAPEFRYEGITKMETDIWSIGTLAFLLLTTQLPTIEDVCTESNVQCSIKNSNTLHLPTMHAHFRSPDLSLLGKFSKGARKFLYNTLKKNPSERGSADYWLAHSWFRQDVATIAEMQTRRIPAAPLVEFMTSSA